jgi:hypothetical protein
MIRKTAIVVSVLCTTVFAYAATAFALETSPEPRIRSNLPVAALPATALGRDEALRVNNLLGELGPATGVTHQSYEQARRLSETAVGPLYLIPGTRGVCMTLAEGAGCGDPGAADRRVYAVVTLDSSGERLVGGGVAEASVRRVEMRVESSRIHALIPVSRGVFSIDVAVPGFKPDKGVTFVGR